MFKMPNRSCFSKRTFLQSKEKSFFYDGFNTAILLSLCILLLVAGCESTLDDTSAMGGMSMSEDDEVAEILSRYYTAECSDIPPVFPKSTMPAPSTSGRNPQDGGQADNFNPYALAENFSFFPLGVQAGAMKSNQALLWTKYAGSVDDTEVVLKVWRDSPNGDQRIFVEEEVVQVKEGGFVHQYAEGLADGTWYFYAFFMREIADEAVAGAVGEPELEPFTARSTVGRFRTAFGAEDKLKLTLGATTCTGNEPKLDAGESIVVPDPINFAPGTHVPFPALSSLAEENVDLMLHLGDVMYGDQVVDLEGYRIAWHKTLETQGYYDYFRKTGGYITWDDHEIFDNWGEKILWRNGERGFIPNNTMVTVNGEQVRQFSLNRLDAGVQTFFENLAVEDMDEGEGYRLWNSYRWGKTAEFFVMDLRYERISVNSPDERRMVSDAQLDFVKAALQQAQDDGVHFKVVMSSVNITNLNGTMWQSRLSLEDRWEGYEDQRTELLDYIVDNNISNVWFLSGDIHIGMVTRIEPKGHKYGHMWEINVGPGGAAYNSGLNLQGRILNLDERIREYYNPDNSDKEIARYPLKDRGVLTDEDYILGETQVKIEIENSFECDKVIFAHDQVEVATLFSFDPLIDSVGIKFVDVNNDLVLFDEEMQQEAPAVQLEEQ